VIRHVGYTRDRFELMSARLRERIYAEARPADSVLVAGPVDRISWDEAQTLQYRPAETGQRFGPLWATYWFRVRATVPDEWRGERVDLLFVSHSEAALWRDGAIVQGLNTGGGGERPDAVLAASAEPGAIELGIELACNGLFGETGAPAELVRCDIARFDAEAWRRYFDFETLRALEAGTHDEAWSGLLREELNRFCNEGDPAILAALYEHRNATHAHALAAIGHAHIDTAWLWPLAETYRKTLRSFSSQLRYMEDYPEYRFACSQAQQYAWIKERNPELWLRLRAAVARGQFVPVGGSWVEPDCNLPSGESLVRQFLHGQRWF
jgi:alpha-mannosidase